MQVLHKKFPRHETKSELSTVLTPEVSGYEYNSEQEHALKLALLTAERFGRLAEMLVEKGVLTLDEALDAAGVSYQVTAL